MGIKFKTAKQIHKYIVTNYHVNSDKIHVYRSSGRYGTIIIRVVYINVAGLLAMNQISSGTISMITEKEIQDLAVDIVNSM